MTSEPIIRHYRGATRLDVEQAYRTEAAQAAGAGYLPATHQWTTDWQGFLLAVTYRKSETPLASADSAQQVTQVQPPPGVSEPAGAVVDQFAPYQQQAHEDPGTQFAPAPQGPASVYEPATQGAPQTTDAPLSFEQPIYDEPVYDEPVYEQPMVAQSAYEQPVYEQPMVAESAYEQPTYDEPTAYEQPAPALQEQTFDPTFDQPLYDQPESQPEIAIAPPEYPAAAEVQDQAALEEPFIDDSLYGQLAPDPIFQSVEVAPESPEAEAPSATSEGLGAPSSVGRNSRLTIQTMEMHCAGEPLRIIRSGFPDVPNLPILERRAWVAENADHVRRSIIQEPRGHRDMYGAILLPPHSDYADMAVLFMHNEGYSTMCGHGVIAITTGLIEEGLYPASEPVTTIRYEVPAGMVAANAATVQLENGDWAVQGVRFTNVPSYLAAQSLTVLPDGITLAGAAAQYGALSVDLAFGGAYYGIVNAADLGLRVVPEQAEALRHAGAAITDVLRRDHTPTHPTDADLSFVYGTIIVDYDPRTSPDGRAGDAHIRNVTIFADAELDRSPCGSGTSAILAQLHARGRIRVGQELVNAGITGEHFLGRVEAETVLGDYPAVTTSVAGTAFITGYSTFIVDERDTLGDGFLLR